MIQNKFIGNLCLNHHKYNGKEQSLRYKYDDSCVTCTLERGKRYKKTNHGKKKKRIADKKYRDNKDCKIMASQYNKEYKKANKKKINTTLRIYWKKQRERLSDVYIMKTLNRAKKKGDTVARLTKDRLGSDLIKAKRLHLQIYRLIKERKNVKKNSSKKNYAKNSKCKRVEK